jgi:co-chaperonin GroES (HSP10)
MTKHSFTHTNIMDIDVSTIKPLRGKIIVRTDDEEMLRIGKTNLVMGYFDDNRNNAHWFGDVVAKHPDVPLELGDRVLFSFLSAKGCDRILSKGVLYLILKYDYVLLYLRDGIHMTNGITLALPADPVKNEIIEYEVNDTHMAILAHVPKDSQYVIGQKVYYLLNQVFELEGQQKTLGANYRVLREDNILGVVRGKLSLEEFNLSSGLCLVKEDEQPEMIGKIIVPSTAKKRVSNIGTIVRSTCYLEENTRIVFRKVKGKPVEMDGQEYIIIKEEYVEATCE